MMQTSMEAVKTILSGGKADFVPSFEMFWADTKRE